MKDGMYTLLGHDDCLTIEDCFELYPTILMFALSRQVLSLYTLASFMILYKLLPFFSFCKKWVISCLFKCR